MLQANQTATVHESEEPGFAQELLTFTLGAEEYAIDILKVQEIRGYDAVTTIANAPSFIKGVINLRGTIVPIVDLRIKFNLPSVEYGGQTVVIVVNVGSRIVGVVVDGVLLAAQGEHQVLAALAIGDGSGQAGLIQVGHDNIISCTDGAAARDGCTAG